MFLRTLAVTTFAFCSPIVALSQTLEEEVREGAEILRALLPLEFEGGVFLTSVEAVDNRTDYLYTVARNRTEVRPPAFRSQTGELLYSIVCQEASMTEVMKRGGQYTYRYDTNDGYTLAYWVFNEKVCNLD